MLRVYAVISDGYGGLSNVRVGRRFSTRKPAFNLMNKHEKAYVTDDFDGHERAINWKGLLGAGRKQHEQVTTTGSTMVRI